VGIPKIVCQENGKRVYPNVIIQIGVPNEFKFQMGVIYKGKGRKNLLSNARGARFYAAKTRRGRVRLPARARAAGAIPEQGMSRSVMSEIRVGEEAQLCVRRVMTEVTRWGQPRAE
jgi:hypothetical protein